MEDQDRLATAAVAAVCHAAERLGVDPVLLAEWLNQDHRLASILERSGRKVTSDAQHHEEERTMREYLAFLDREIARQRHARGWRD